MKLLFDENLSPRLISAFQDLFPESRHVSAVGLERATDEEVWQFALRNAFAIISKDSDFHQLSFLRGAPPKVIWLRVGNATTAAIEATLRDNVSRVSRFLAEEESAFLVIGSEL